ncbi:MAG: hypothetical protein A2Z18_08015, partial [Armatimonadetes bacterium RBG_16_58_9]
MPQSNSTRKRTGRPGLARVLAGKIVRRIARQARTAAIPLARRMIRYPPAESHGSSSRRGSYYFRHEDRDEIVRAWRETFDHEADIVAAADEVCDHVFDLLGSGKKALGDPIDWHTDFKSGKSWPSHRPLRPGEITSAGAGADIKVVWELSRFQQVGVLGRAYWLTGDEKYATEFANEVSSWIEANPWGRGPNWACAMDVAIRSANWILGYHFFERCTSLDDAFHSTFLRSLWEHGWFIERNLERQQINSNHYIADLAGFFALGVFFADTGRGRRWRDLSYDRMCDQVREQVLADGVDYEKSISYHRLVLEMVAYTFCLARKNGMAVPDDVAQRWMRMFEFTAAYTKPDGTAPRIGDSDDGVFYKFADRKSDHAYLLSLGASVFDRPDFAAVSSRLSEEAFWTLGPESKPEFEELARTFRDRGIPKQRTPKSAAFPDGGFYIIRSDRHYAIIDGGDNGMNGLGAHAHCDALSFELYAVDKTFIVDPGTYVYTADPRWRNRFRSTEYHNTVMVDEEQIHPIPEKWLFALPDAGDVKVTRWDIGDESVVFAGEHDAYRRLRDPVTHRRTVMFDLQSETWTIEDEMDGSGNHTFESRLHFAPG